MSHMEKSRRDIEKGIDKNKQEVEKGQKKLDQDVGDKKLVAEVAAKMRGKGTIEGMDKIAKKGEQAGEKVDRQADRDTQELDKSAHHPAKERETESEGTSRSDQTRCT